MLENFRAQKIIWDRANKKIFEAIEANSGDSNGRKLVVQVINQEVSENLSGTTLSLGWKSRNGAKGLDAFNVVDASKGIFEIYYTTEMLSNIGNIEASLILINSTGRIESSAFTISVRPSTVDDESIESENSFTALTEALVKVNGLEANYAPRLNEVNAQLAQIVQQKINKIPASFLEKVKNRVHSPEGFSWTDAPIKIYQNQLGEMSTDFNASDHQHIGAGKTYYVDPINGNDLNDGLTLSNAIKSIYVARGKEDVDIIMLADGVYTDVSGFNNSSGEITSNRKNLSIKAIEGAKPIVTTGRNNLTFSLTSGKTKTYQASRTQVVDVLDLNKVDIYGDPQQLKRVNSIDDVESTKGSYYYASPMLYVHTFDDRAPDDKVIALMNLYNFRIVGDYKTYFENITFLGGKEGCVSGVVSSGTDSTLIIAKNCEFKYSTDGSGGLMTYGADSYLQNCIAARNKKDGFNYHRNMNNRVNYAIEVDCTGRHNGIGGGTDQDNGSTMHDGGKMIRVNGVYFGNEGPNVHDVTAGTESWNLGCQSFGSLATSLLRNANYQMETGKMWLDSCIGYGSNRALVAGSNSTFLMRNSVFDDGDIIVNTGNNATLGDY